MGPTLARRLSILCDPDSLEEQPESSGAVYFTGWAKIKGRKVMVIAADPDPLSEPADLSFSSSRYVKALQQADSAASPVVFLHDSPAPYKSGRTAFQGAGVELMMGKNGVGRQYFEIARLSGRVPLVCAVFGNMAQAQAFPTVMCDGMVMLENSSISVARPDAVAEMLNEKVSYKDLGGARIHSRLIADCDQVVSNEDDALAWVRNFLSYLPSHKDESPPLLNVTPRNPDVPGISEIIPSRLNRPFDVRQVIASVVDENQFLELGHDFAGEIVTGFSRIRGRVAGIAANNPKVNGGIFFPETCLKLIRFIKLCNAFNLPIVFLADTPGFMIGKDVEKRGIVSAGAALFTAIAKTRVPRLCIVLRRAYTAGLYAMSGSGFLPLAIYALPGASIAVYGPEAVARFMDRLDLPPDQKKGILRKMEKESRLEFLVEQGFLNGIIEPDQVRETIAGFLSKEMDGGI
ncbi:MAG: hypothetical protein JRD04_07670 [Deltaproteobacteria bacterium]|nr:hypothetical protein [Deltaproteobacteria bacterium]